MYVVQDGEVEIVLEENGAEVVLRSAGRNEVIGEMAVIDHKPRSATIRAKGRARTPPGYLTDRLLLRPR